MTSKRVSAPFDLMKELDSDDDEPKKQTTLTTQTATVAPQTAPKPLCVCIGEKIDWCEDYVRLLLAHRRILACWGCCGRSRRLPTVRLGPNSAQPLYGCVAALFTCSQKSDRVVCEIQAEGGARLRRRSSRPSTWAWRSSRKTNGGSSHHSDGLN